MTDNTYHSQLAALKDNPIFQLSMSSKELFHSNFLYWLGTAEKLRPYFKQVINDLYGSKKMDWNEDKFIVLREHEHLDFCICKDAGKNKAGKQKIGDLLFVLENKFKSIATAQQLNGYEKLCDAHSKQKPILVLLTLAKDFTEKANIEKKKIWHIVNYQEYSTILKEYLNLLPSDDNEFTKQLIGKYISFIETFSNGLNAELTKVLEDLKSKKWKDIINNPSFDNLRCNDIWQKVLMHKFAQILANKAKGYIIDFNANDDLSIFNDENKNDRKLYIGVNLLHSQALVGISCLVDEDHIFTLQQQGSAELRAGIIIRNRDKAKIGSKPKMKTELSKHELWKQKVSEIIMNVHLSEYIKPYRMHKNDPEDTYGVFDNTTKTSFYYSKCCGKKNVSETLDYMIKTIKKIAERT